MGPSVGQRCDHKGFPPDGGRENVSMLLRDRLCVGDEVHQRVITHVTDHRRRLPIRPQLQVRGPVWDSALLVPLVRGCFRLMGAAGAA
jgi:hypothetical protein